MVKVLVEQWDIFMYQMVVMGDGVNDFKMMDVVVLGVVFEVKFIVNVQVDVVICYFGLDVMLVYLCL